MVKWIDLYDGEVQEFNASEDPALIYRWDRPVKYDDLTIEMLVEALQNCYKRMSGSYG